MARPRRNPALVGRLVARLQYAGHSILTHITVAVPACNEAERILSHLKALDLAAASVKARVSVYVFANNCRDETAERAANFHADHADIVVERAELEAPDRTAGAARRLAVLRALVAVPRTDLIVTTDADSEMRPDCLEVCRTEIGAGADLVCGTISFSPTPELRHAPSLRRYDRTAGPYADLMRELRFAVDVVCGRQLPGATPHYTTSGACIALTRAFHDRIGGLPRVPCGEDRALVRLAEQCGARVSYSRNAHSVVSARLVGRAIGGMADTLCRRLGADDPDCDEAFLTARAARRAWGAARAAAARGRHPVLPNASRPMRLSELERELPRMQAFLTSEVRPDLASAAHAASPRVA